MINRKGYSKATSSTLCQKCLKRGHYSYECTAARQDRPYHSRPSRTQQLSNPKLKQKLADVKPPEVESLLGKRLVKTEEKWVEKSSTVMSHSRARSVSSSDSVSTISTAASRPSPPPQGPQRRRDSTSRRGRRSRSPAVLRKRSRSRSPDYDRQHGKQRSDEKPAYRARSLSPYSRRLAMSRKD